jgi:hypothetical protein
MSEIKKTIGEIFNQLAEGLETGALASVVIGVTTLGSEHGTGEIIRGAEIAQNANPDIKVVLIGPKVESTLKQYVVETDQEGHKLMEELLDSGEIHGCVTMHYNFPIGVATVGRVITPGKGKEMIIATTTGTSSTDRVEGMVKNAIYGISVAKALGINKPSVGILNLDGARQVERHLKTLNDKGYEINFAGSVRSDGGSVMRGNDLLVGATDVMVTDTLTGNILMKIFSSFTTGGSYESLGYGYGPGVGEGYERIINILSRASGAPVVAGAIKFAAELAKGKLVETAQREIAQAKKAGMDNLCIISPLKIDVPKEVKVPPKKVVDREIVGVDILELENAVSSLWEAGVYAESGMGCTGPVVLINPEDLDKAKDVLTSKNYL